MAQEKTGVARWNEDAGVGRHKKSESDKRRRQVWLVLLAVLCIACLACAWPVGERITRGLWLKGGTAVTSVVTTDEGAEPTSDQLNQVASAIKRRVSAAGVSDVAASVEDGGRIVVDLPWTVDADALAPLLCGAGKLEFVAFDQIGDADALAKLNAGGKNAHMEEGTYTPFLDGSHVKSCTVTEVSSGSYALTFVFDDEGAQAFADETRELAERNGSIAIAVDGTIVSAASVSQEIDGGQVSISGDYSSEQANAIKAVASGTALPLVITQEGSEKIGPLLGQSGCIALVAVAAAGLVAVAAYAFARYRRLAIVPAGALVVYALVMLGIMAVFSRANLFVLTMPAVVCGFAVAALTAFAALNVVDRFAAKVRGGGSVRGAALSCVGEGLNVLRAPVAVVGVVAIVMLFVPSALAREVGTTVVLGLVSGIVGVFWYGIVLLRLLAMGTIQNDASAWGVEASGAADTALGETAS